jgi:hypothetical protein
MFYNNPNRKVKRLQKLLTYSSSIDNDGIKQKSIKMISNGEKTKVDLYSRNDDDIRKKSMQFDNNKTNLAKLLKVDPVFGDLDTRLYNDFLVNVKSNKSKSKSKSIRTNKIKNKITNGKNKNTNRNKRVTKKYYKSKSNKSKSNKSKSNKSKSVSSSSSNKKRNTRRKK